MTLLGTVIVTLLALWVTLLLADACCIVSGAIRNYLHFRRLRKAHRVGHTVIYP